MSVAALVPMVGAVFKHTEKILCLTEASEEDFLNSMYNTVDMDKLVVKSVRRLDDYESLKNHEPSERFAAALGRLIRSTMASVEANESKGEGIKAILTSGMNLTLLTESLRANLKIPIFDHCSLFTFLNFGNGQSRFNKSPNHEGSKQQNREVGILRLDYHYPPAVGDAAHPDSFTYNVHYSQVDELHFEVAQEGTINEELVENFKSALSELEARNVVGIAGDCGFMMHYQCLVRHLSQHTPVFMSSLIFAGTLSCLCRPHERVLILTANDKTLVPGKDKLLRESGITVTDDDKILIRGCQDIPGFDAVLKAEKVDVPVVREHMKVFVENIIKQESEHPIAFVLLECTELPPYADAIRQVTGLPTYDIVNLIDFFHSATDENAWNSGGFPPHNPEFWKSYLSKGRVLKRANARQSM
jgi:hypothetical protein